MVSVGAGPVVKFVVWLFGNNAPPGTLLGDKFGRHFKGCSEERFSKAKEYPKRRE